MRCLFSKIYFNLVGVLCSSSLIVLFYFLRKNPRNPIFAKRNSVGVFLPNTFEQHYPRCPCEGQKGIKMANSLHHRFICARPSAISARILARCWACLGFRITQEDPLLLKSGSSQDGTCDWKQLSRGTQPGCTLGHRLEACRQNPAHRHIALTQHSDFLLNIE